MATTPEGKVKAKVSTLLKSYGPKLYYEMPVPSGFGKMTLDYIGWINGWAFSIETKRPGKKPTDRQSATIAQMQAAGAAVFVIDNVDGLGPLKEWLDERAG